MSRNSAKSEVNPSDTYPFLHTAICPLRIMLFHIGHKPVDEANLRIIDIYADLLTGKALLNLARELKCL